MQYIFLRYVYTQKKALAAMWSSCLTALHGSLYLNIPVQKPVKLFFFSSADCKYNWFSCSSSKIHAYLMFK